MKLWLCIDGLTQWLLCTVVIGNPAQPSLVTFTLDFFSGQTLTIDVTGKWSAGPATGGSNEVFLLQNDFALITPSGSESPTSKVFGYKTVPYAAA